MEARDSKCGERNVYKRFKYTASTQRHRRRAPTGKVYATKKRKEEKEQTEQEQIRHEVGETSKKKVHKSSRE